MLATTHSVAGAYKRVISFMSHTSATAHSLVGAYKRVRTSHVAYNSDDLSHVSYISHDSLRRLGIRQGLQSTHTHTHTQTHTNIHTHTQTYIHTHTKSNKHTYTHTHTHSHTYTNTQTHFIRSSRVSYATDRGDRTDHNYDCQKFQQVFTGVPEFFKHVFTGVPFKL